VSQGTLAEPQPLGIEADEPGSMWLEKGRLMIRQRTARAYDGVDLLVTAPSEAKLQVQLTAADDKQQSPQIELPLADLSTEFRNLRLDDHDNRVLVRRSPGDFLRVHTSHSSMVFAPGERLKLEVTPYLLPSADGKSRLKVQLTDGRDVQELWSKQCDMRGRDDEPIALEVPLPDDEGVYNVTLSIVSGQSWPHTVRPSLHWKRPVAERKVQLLVLGRNRPSVSAKPRELTLVMEIDPASPRWWEKVKLPTLPRLPRMPKGPLGSGDAQPGQHSLGDLVQLRPSNDPTDASWEAYWLNLSTPGRPHVLEVEYPSDVPQTLGVSILEPNAAGALVPIGLDTGVDVTEELFGGSPHWAKHRVLFWPRTNAPLVLLTNRRAQSPAMFGKIRVLAGWDHLPESLPLGADVPQRLMAAYMDRPLLPENFSATELLDSWSGRSLDDWRTFHEAGGRLIEYLRHVGYNGLMINVAADGSAIYPSRVLEPTPRYDTGVFFASAQDPMRKDVLEMLLRMFDREGLRLIPSIEFASPLPELEALRRRGGSEAEGLQWIGPEGVSWCKTYSTRRGLAPYYNMLDPRVQDAMLSAVRELVDRYASHPSLAGLGVRLSAYGYAQLPGPDWGMDDATIGRFVRDTGAVVPGEGPERFAARATLLNGEAHRSQWLKWRADQCHRFYLRMHEVLASAKPGARLYLAGAEMFTGPEIEAELRPTLPRRATLADALLHVGIDPRQYLEDRGVVLLRPQRIVPSTRLPVQAADLEISQMPEADSFFHALPQPGSLLYHPPQEIHLPSFDQKSPFRPSFAWLVTEPVFAGPQNRQRFVHSVATMDSQMLIDGGWLLPLGQEDSIRDVAAAFRRLPPVRFTDVIEDHATPAQPVTFRYATFNGRTYAYAINDAPFPTTAQIQVEGPTGCKLRELTGSRRQAPLAADGTTLSWSVELEPYDLVAVEFSEPNVKLAVPRVTVSDSVRTALGQRIQQLGARTAALRSPPLLQVLDNADFERPPTASESVPGWSVSRRLGVTIQTDKSQQHGGTQSVRVSSDGPIACLVSRPFDAPCTGRLSMSVWIRLADPSQQPSLRLAIEGKLVGRDYYRFAAIGKPPGPTQPAVPIATTWGQYIFQIDDLPLDGLSQLRVRFDLMGAGEVWIDDVQLFGLAFNETELRSLYKLITLASVDLQNGQIGDCMGLLDGYWPRFLMENVPMASPAAAPALAGRPEDLQTPPAASPAPPQPTSWLDRVKGMLPDRLR
jgi:hypothetical protein